MACVNVLNFDEGYVYEGVFLIISLMDLSMASISYQVTFYIFKNSFTAVLWRGTSEQLMIVTLR